MYLQSELDKETSWELCRGGGRPVWQEKGSLTWWASSQIQKKNKQKLW